jgi:ketosteroid isomerase-like protein
MLKNYLLLVTGLIALAACGPKAGDPAADEAALKADSGAWFDAYNGGNADGVANLYAAIKAYIEPDIKATKEAGLTVKNGELTGAGASGDLAWLSGTFSLVNASGDTVDTGKYLSVHRRENGKWLMIRDTWNSDAPPAAANAPAPATN